MADPLAGFRAQWVSSGLVLVEEAFAMKQTHRRARRAFVNSTRAIKCTRLQRLRMVSAIRNPTQTFGRSPTRQPRTD